MIPEDELLSAIDGKQGAEFVPIIANTPLLKQFQNEAIEGTLLIVS